MIRKYMWITFNSVREMVTQLKKKVKYGRIVTNKTVSSILIAENVSSYPNLRNSAKNLFVKILSQT